MYERQSQWSAGQAGRKARRKGQLTDNTTTMKENKQSMNNNNKQTIKQCIHVLLVVLVLGVAMWLGNTQVFYKVPSQALLPGTSPANTGGYDVSALTSNGTLVEGQGTVRMMYAWYSSSDDDAHTTTLTDTSSNQWTVKDLPITETHLILLWIADNNTDTITDDVVVQVWQDMANLQPGWHNGVVVINN